MIEASELTYSYQAGRKMEYPALRVEKGSSLLLLGKSGCGKTTLLHMLAGLLKPQQGTISIQGTAITQLAEKNLDRFRGQQIGIIFQRSYFVQSLSVLDNIALAPYFAGKKTDRTAIDTLAERLGIQSLLHQLPASLSQGEQQRAGIARAIVHRPHVVLADEPTSNLDDDNAATVATLLLDLCESYGAALIVVTHDERLKKLFTNQLTLA